MMVDVEIVHVAPSGRTLSSPGLRYTVGVRSSLLLTCVSVWSYYTARTARHGCSVHVAKSYFYITYD